MIDGAAWIRRLGLEEHPEGGWFRRIYTAASTIETENGARPLATSIHYLLTRERPGGRLHRNRSDILHFLIDGGPVEYLLVTADGELRRVALGHEERFLMVPGGWWKASQLMTGAPHALVAEVVTPGFDFADHQFATLDDLRRECPQHLPVLSDFVAGSSAR